MRIIYASLKNVCLCLAVLASSTHLMSAHSLQPDSINSALGLTSAPKRIAGGGMPVRDSVWEGYASDIKSGDVIIDPYVFDIITEVYSKYRRIGCWFDNSIVYEKDGVKYEMDATENSHQAVAHLVSDSMKIWEVPDSFEYGDKIYYVYEINTRLNMDTDGSLFKDKGLGEMNYNLTKIVFPDYPELEIAGFSNFLSLEEVAFKRTEYDDIIIFHRFSNCPSLKKIVLPEGVSSLSQESFKNCDNLQQIIMPNSLEDLENEVFSECDKLERIYIPAGVKSIGKKVLSGCPNLKEITVDPNNPYFDSRENCNAIIDSKTGKLIIGCNGTVIPNSVTSIGENAFWGSGIESITIPESVTEIGESAFEKCLSLKIVTLPSSVTSINDRAFYDCMELSSIALPSKLKTIGMEAFAYCQSMIELKIPASVDNIGMNICMDCPNMKSIKVDSKNPVYDSRNNCKAIIETATDRIVLGIANTSIPKTVKSIGSYAFQTSLIDKLYIPRNVIHIGTGAFSYCRSLSTISVDPRNPVYDSRDNCNAIIETATNTLITGCIRTEIPQSVIAIGKSAFCGGLTPSILNFSDNIKVIDDYAFVDCEQINTIILPTTLDYIGTNAFANCNSLNNIEINNIKSWGFATFIHDNSLINVEFNVPISSIGEEAFGSCSSLENLVLPEGLDSINLIAFQNCNKLKYVKYPSTLKYIGEQAFCNCTSLTSPILPEGILHINLSAFMYCHNITELDIPKSAVNTIYNSGGCLRNLRVLKLPSPDALRNLWMPNCYNLEKIIIK